MKKKRKLKKWVKVTLFILFITIITLIIMKGVNDFKKLANDCDKSKGYICTYYEIRQHSLSK